MVQIDTTIIRKNISHHRYNSHAINRDRGQVWILEMEPDRFNSAFVIFISSMAAKFVSYQNQLRIFTTLSSIFG